VKDDLNLIHDVITYSGPKGKSLNFNLLIPALTINILSLVFPIAILLVFDRIIPNKSLDSLNWIILGGIIAVFFEAILKYTRMNTTLRAANEYEYKTGIKLFNETIHNIKRTDTNTGKIYTAFNSISKLRNLYTGNIFQTLLDLPFCILFVGIIANISVSIAIYLVAISIIYILLSILLIRTVIDEKKNEEYFSEQTKFNFLITIFSNLIGIKTAHAEEWVLRKNEKLLAESAGKMFINSYIDSLNSSISSVMGQLLFYGVFAVGGFLVTQNQLTIGELTACSFLSRRIFQPIQGISSLLLSLSTYKMAQANIDEVLSKSEDENSQGNKLEYVSRYHLEGQVYLNNINLDIDGIKYCDNLNLVLEPRRTIYLTGNNKLGTTILAKVISGLQNVDSGIMTIDNIDIENITLPNLSGIISYIPPKGSVIKGSVIENITVFDIQKNALAQDIILMLGQKKLVADLPHGFETMIDSQNVEFYPGLRETLTIARELIKRPKVLILDRIDEYMDRTDFNSYLWLLKMLHRRLTIIIISKNEEFFNIADNSYEYINGSISNFHEREKEL
jgi:ATP-binding cassette subfamily C protein LapB